MYLGYFGFDAPPFSIVPDHRAFYMSQSHREAVAHLLYALNQSGGFVRLTGEVGTGKTTVSRYLLAHLPEDVDVALLLNPRITEKEMLQTICDELDIRYYKSDSQKDLVTRLNTRLLEAHSRGRKTALIIDEAQNLSADVLEQIRLLTNLETSRDKLLQIILIAQPELTRMLQRHDLRQLCQRIVGRFELEPLSREETEEYIAHRISIAGGRESIFTGGAVHRVHRLSKGIPRIINIICDRALLGAFGQSKKKIDRRMISRAAQEVLEVKTRSGRINPFSWIKYAALAVVPLAVYVFLENSDKAVESLTAPRKAPPELSDRENREDKNQSGSSHRAVDENAVGDKDFSVDSAFRPGGL